MNHVGREGTLITTLVELSDKVLNVRRQISGKQDMEAEALVVGLDWPILRQNRRFCLDGRTHW